MRNHELLFLIEVKEEKVMLVTTKRVDKYAVLSTARFLSVTCAESAIEHNDKLAYRQAEMMYDFLNKQIARDGECAFVDARVPSSPFPEWPAPEMRVIFSDDEIDTWPVQFSDSSCISEADSADVPF